jgi:hypothetical protein
VIIQYPKSYNKCVSFATWSNRDVSRYRIHTQDEKLPRSVLTEVQAKWEKGIYAIPVCREYVDVEVLYKNASLWDSQNRKILLKANKWPGP